MKITTKMLILSSVFISFGSSESNAGGPWEMLERMGGLMRSWRAPKAVEHKEESRQWYTRKEEINRWRLQQTEGVNIFQQFMRTYNAGQGFGIEVKEEDLPEQMDMKDSISPLTNSSSWLSQTIILELSGWKRTKLVEQQDTNDSTSSQKMSDESLSHVMEPKRSSSIFLEKGSAIDNSRDLPKPRSPLSDSQLIRVLDTLDDLEKNCLKGSGKGKEKGSFEGDRKEDVSVILDAPKAGKGKEKGSFPGDRKDNIREIIDTLKAGEGKGASEKELTGTQKVVTKKKALSPEEEDLGDIVDHYPFSYSSVVGLNNTVKKTRRGSRDTIFFDVHELDDEETSIASDMSSSGEWWIDPTWVVDENEEKFIKKQTEKRAKKQKNH